MLGAWRSAVQFTFHSVNTPHPKNRKGAGSVQTVAAAATAGAATADNQNKRG